MSSNAPSLLAFAIAFALGLPQSSCKNQGPPANSAQGAQTAAATPPNGPKATGVPTTPAAVPQVPAATAPEPPAKPGEGFPTRPLMSAEKASSAPIDTMESLTEVALAAVATADAQLFQRVLFSAKDAKTMCPEMLADGNAAIAERKFAQERQRLTEAMTACKRFDWSQAKRLTESGGAVEGPEPRCSDVVAHRTIRVHFAYQGQHLLVSLAKPARSKDGKRWVTAEPPKCEITPKSLPIPKAQAKAKLVSSAKAFVTAACSCADEACYAGATAKYVNPMGAIAGPHRWRPEEEAVIQMFLKRGQKCQPKVGP